MSASDEVTAMLEAMVQKVRRQYMAWVEARIDELGSVGYRGPLFAWMTMADMKSVQVHTGLHEPDAATLGNAMNARRFDITDETAAIWTMNRARLSVLDLLDIDPVKP